MPVILSDYDLKISSVGGTPSMGFMLIKDEGHRVYQLEDYRTLSPRVLTMGEVTQAELPVEVEAPWYQENWQAGMGLVNHRLGLGQYGIAEGYKVDTTSPSGILRLARQVQSTTVNGGDPSQYFPTGFAMVGSEVKAFIGRDTYSWDYTNTRWAYQSEPETITDSLYRNGVEYEGNTYVPHWLTGETPYHHLYKADADSGWTRSTLVPSAKYLAKADGKIWGAYIRDEADSTIDAVTLTYDASSSGAATGATSITVSHTCTGNNRGLIVGVSASSTIADNRRYPSGVTYAGVAMTEVGKLVNGNAGVSIWALSAPTSGANNIVATFAAAFDDCVLGGVSFTNAHQTTATLAPAANFASATGSSAAPSVAVTTTPKGIVVGVVAVLINTALSPGDSETERWDAGSATVTAIRGGGFTESPAAGVTSITIAPTSGDAGWAIGGIEVASIIIASDDTTITTTATGTSLAVNDEILLRSTTTPAANEELMLVTQVNATSIVVTRGYRGTTAVAYAGVPRNIYKATYNVNQVRSATDLTNTGAWSSAYTIGTSDAPITEITPYYNAAGAELLLVCKTDGLWTMTAAGVIVHLYSLVTQQDPNHFRGAFSWDGNRRVVLPLGAGGMFELYDDVIRDISFSKTMADQTHLHGRVVAVTADATHVFALVQEAANTRYHLMMAELVAISGSTDYRWHHVGRKAYTTGTNLNQNALMACGVPSGATTHHRVWWGLSSTGSSLLPYFYTISATDAQDQYCSDDDGYAISVKADWNYPNANKRFQKVVVTTATCDSDDYWEVQYRVDGGDWTYITGAQGTSQIKANGSNTLTFAAGVTGKVLELKFLAIQGASTAVTPQILDFRVTAQMRLDTIDILPCQVYLAEGQRKRNGAREPRSVAARLSQLESWHDQAAEVTVVDARGTSRSMVFLKGSFRCRELADRYLWEPEYAVGFMLAAC